MRIYMQYHSFLLLSLLFACCGTTATPTGYGQVEATNSRSLDSTETILDTLNVSIAHYQIGCTQEGASLCYQIIDKDREQTYYSPYPIAGLEYQWGTNYEATVSRATVENPITDELEYRFTLIELQSAETVGDTLIFPLIIDQEYLPKGVEGKMFGQLVGDGPNVIIPEELNAAWLEKWSSYGLFTAKFKHSTEDPNTIILVDFSPQ